MTSPRSKETSSKPRCKRPNSSSGNAARRWFDRALLEYVAVGIRCTPLGSARFTNRTVLRVYHETSQTFGICAPTHRLRCSVDLLLLHNSLTVGDRILEVWLFSFSSDRSDNEDRSRVEIGSFQQGTTPNLFPWPGERYQKVSTKRRSVTGS